jgi:hypothetical protein
MPLIFRSMIEKADGLPELGRSARKLGVRTGDHTTPDILAVNPGDIVLPGDGGLSVAPDDPMFLPRHRRAAILGATGVDPVWALDVSDLPAELALVRDSATHALIEALNAMTLAEYEAALAQTRVKWRVYAR